MGQNKDTETNTEILARLIASKIDRDLIRFMSLPMTPCNHPEAFNLIQYRSKDNTEAEVLWNSRDGVTPFTVASRNGLQMMYHVDWARDVKSVNFVPPKGMRIFVDATVELFLPGAREYVNQYWDGDGTQMNPGIKNHPHFAQFNGDKEAVAVFMATDWSKEGSAPFIKTVE